MDNLSDQERKKLKEKSFVSELGRFFPDTMDNLIDALKISKEETIKHQNEGKLAIIPFLLEYFNIF